jgi:ATP-dependent Clp protease ATP-binding subunit ClpA
VTFAIPIFVEERAGGIAAPAFIARPLFHPKPVQRAEKLSRALAKLSNDLHQLLHDLGKDPRHDELAEWTFNPLIEEATLDLRLELDSGSHKRTFFFAGYEALEKKLFFTPTISELHFGVRKGESLAERATTVLTRHLRDVERQGGEANLDEYALIGKARLATIEIAVHPAALAKKAKKPTRAILFGGEEKKDGEQELRKTGRAMHAMYPDDLDRAVGRDREVEELGRLLAASDRRAILLAGPRKVGKTAIIHELAWRISAQKKERFAGSREIWLVSPMRLISGMSYLGEWENRVLAILEFLKSKDRVLYFDDLLGLFTAGISAASDLNVGQVLRPWLEKRLVRVIAEITPEAWRVLRERDRAFADLFQVMPVNEPPEPETLRVLVNVARVLEEENKCAFDLETVPAVYDLHRRFATDAAFPGKAAGFLRRLAVRYAGGHANRWSALHEFHQQSGLQVAMLDERTTLQRAEILEQLRKGVIGQDHALEAFADVLAALKARLNDPRRPLGTMLLLGPTGVGKTQAAKTLASYLFESNERLLRFDMNEYVDAASATRLIGTPMEPEGLLTSAVRRQPFSVLLFDEIEKAAPEVFDMLLAVLDEGRLTDALGRVTDFTQTVILLTSNLGVREARARLGFRASAAAVESDDGIYIAAAEKFFRPEFFNRLDRVIPFRTLGRQELETITRQQLGQLLSRDGMKRRNGLLNVTPEAMTRLVELGHHPQLGARALKRVIEREVAQPLAQKLAELPPGTPLIANLAMRGEGFDLGLKDLSPVERSVFWPELLVKGQTISRTGTTTMGTIGKDSSPQPPAPRAARELAEWTRRVLEGVYAALDRIERHLAEDAPSGKIELGKLSRAQENYFLCREHFKKAERLAQAVERSQERPRGTGTPMKVPRARPLKLVIRQEISGNPRFDREREAIALRDHLRDLEPEKVEVPDSPLTALLRELALLEILTARPLDDRPALLIFRACTEVDKSAVFRLARRYAECLGHIWGNPAKLAFEPRDENELLLKTIFGELPGRAQGMYFNGINARRLLPEKTGTILTRRSDGGTGIILMTVAEAGSEAEAFDLAKKMADSIDALEPDEFGPVIQTLIENESLTDFRSGVVISADVPVEELRALILYSLKLPEELAAVMRNA